MAWVAGVGHASRALGRYRFNPWRAPGSAPVFDACGKAGGGLFQKWTSAGIQYKNTTHAKQVSSGRNGGIVRADAVYAVQGDLGSAVLPPRDTGVVWKAGDVVEASWVMRTNHGGQ